MTSGRGHVRTAGALARTQVVAAVVLVTAAAATTSSEPASGATVAFAISGSVKGLYPGATLSLKLRVANHESFKIAVTSIVTTVHDASANCPASDLSVAAFSGQLFVPASGTAAVHVAAHMSHAAGNVCQGVTFPLTYVGHATKA